MNIQLTNIELNYLKLINRKDRKYLLSDDSYLYLQNLFNLFKNRFTEDTLKEPHLLSAFFEVFHDLIFLERDDKSPKFQESLIELSHHKNFKILFEIEIDAKLDAQKIFVFKEYFTYQSTENKIELYKIYFKDKDLNDAHTMIDCQRMMKRLVDVEAIYHFFQDNDEILFNVVSEKISDILKNNHYVIKNFKDSPELAFLFKKTKDNTHRITTAEIYTLLEFSVKFKDSECFKEIVRIIDKENIIKRLNREKRLKIVNGIKRISVSKGKLLEKEILNIFGLNIPVDIDEHHISFHDLTIESQLFMLTIKDNEGLINKLLRETLSPEYFSFKGAFAELNEVYKELLILNYKF